MFPLCIDLDLIIGRFVRRPVGGRSAVDGCASTVSMSWEHFRYNHLRVVPTAFNESPRLFDRVNELSRSADEEEQKTNLNTFL